MSRRLSSLSKNHKGQKVKNKKVAFIRFRGKTKLMYFRKLDTTNQLRDGGLVQLDDSSNLEPPRNDSTDRPLGVCRQNVGLTDSTQLQIPVEVPVENAVEWTVDVDSDAGLVDSDVGRYCGIDTTGGDNVLAGDSCGMRIDRSDTAMRAVLITARISASRAIVTLANTAWDKGTGDSAFG